VLVAREGSWSATPFFALHFWSLCIEEQFYLVWPLLVTRLSRESLRRVCTWALVGSFALRT